MQLIKWLAILLLLLGLTAATLQAAENQRPPSDFGSFAFQAKYQITRNDSKIGNASITLALTDSLAILDYYSKVSRFFLTDERSERTVYRLLDNTNTIIPISPNTYEYIRTGTGPDDQLFIDFEQQTIQSDDGTISFDTEYNDNQFFRLDIPFRLQNGLPIPSQYEFYNYRGEARSYIVEQREKQILNLPIGQVEAEYFVITRPNSTRRVTHAWFAAKYQYQLIRLNQFKDGKEQADMRLKSFTLIPSKTVPK